MMDNKTQKKKIIISIICIMLLILFSGGIVYAFYNYTRVGQNKNTLNTANLTFEFENTEYIWLENAYPITTEQGISLEFDGSSILDTVDGGLAKFKVTGGHSSGAIHYYVSLVKEDITSVYTSSSNLYSIDPSTKVGQLPDGAVSINLQSSINNIHEETGLVNELKELVNPGISFSQSTDDYGYINTTESIRISDLPLGGLNNSERILGYGEMSGSSGTRYFELRMWINDTVLINNDIRDNCLLNTDSSKINEHGIGYCENVEELPEEINYVYSTGEFSKLYYSTKIKVSVTNTSNTLISNDTPILKKLKQANTPILDSTVENMFDHISDGHENGLYELDSSKNDPYPIYYYRGNVDNRLIFANYCWRIVRTTETGGTKLIFDGNAVDNKCNNSGLNSLLSKVEFNNIYTSPAYGGYMYGDYRIGYEKKEIELLSGNIIYGNDITWNGQNYTLTDPIEKNVSNWINDYEETSTSGLRYHHYSCLNSSNTCQKVYYIYYINTTTMYYIALENGLTHLDALNNTLDDENKYPSNMYTYLNNFYRDHLLDYNDYIEDTVYCGDREIYRLNGWDKDNDNISSLLYMTSKRLTTRTPNLVCSDKHDSYTVSKQNGNGDLEYPVGLITVDEVMYAGGKSGTDNNSYYLYIGENFWTMSPNDMYFSTASNSYVFGTGKIISAGVSSTMGVRPVISLKSDVFIKSGTGTSNDPYIVN